MALEKATLYEEPFEPTHPVIQNFWSVVHGFTQVRPVVFVCGAVAGCPTPPPPHLPPPPPPPLSPRITACARAGCLPMECTSLPHRFPTPPCGMSVVRLPFGPVPPCAPGREETVLVVLHGE